MYSPELESVQLPRNDVSEWFPSVANTGEMFVADIYQGLGDVPRDSIKARRIVQIFFKSTWIANDPPIGAAGEENTRAIPRTVPVEADGSARFLVPAHKPLRFQALDQDGDAYQTMRRSTSRCWPGAGDGKPRLLNSGTDPFTARENPWPQRFGLFTDIRLAPGF